MTSNRAGYGARAQANLFAVADSLHIIGSRQFGGADQFFVRLVAALNRAGHSAVPICRPRSPVDRALESLALPALHLPMASQWDYWTMWQLGRWIRRYTPPIVQTYMGRATRLTRVSPRSPTVHIARLGGYYKIDGYYRHAHAWIGNTVGIRDYLLEQKLPSDRVFYIGNFVPPPGAGPSGTSALPVLPSGHAWVIFSLGRFIEKKGFDVLLKAFAELPHVIADRQPILVLAGDGPERTRLHALAKDLGILDRVRWPGWLDDPTPFYRSADLFVCPSHDEPLGNVILEAWNHQLPVLATATRGAKELLQGPLNAWLTPVGDPAALALALQATLNAGPAFLLEAGVKGQEILMREHSEQAVVSAYLELYRQLSSSRGKH